MDVDAVLLQRTGCSQSTFHDLMRSSGAFHFYPADQTAFCFGQSLHFMASALSACSASSAGIRRTDASTIAGFFYLRGRTAFAAHRGVSIIFLNAVFCGCWTQRFSSSIGKTAAAVVYHLAPIMMWPRKLSIIRVIVLRE